MMQGVKWVLVMHMYLGDRERERKKERETGNFLDCCQMTIILKLTWEDQNEMVQFSGATTVTPGGQIAALTREKATVLPFDHEKRACCFFVFVSPSPDRITFPGSTSFAEKDLKGLSEKGMLIGDWRVQVPSEDAVRSLGFTTPPATGYLGVKSLGDDVS